MTITWNEELEVGLEIIDTQHKELIERFNTLMNACSAGKGRDELESSLDFLRDYTVQHFSDEEALQRKINFPEFERHKGLHEGFKVTVANLVTQFKNEGPSSALVVKLSTDVGDWLIKHIKREDVKVASYSSQVAAMDQN
jgi:hemerythrin-like metal-binding protein